MRTLIASFTIALLGVSTAAWSAPGRSPQPASWSKALSSRLSNLPRPARTKRVVRHDAKRVVSTERKKNSDGSTTLLRRTYRLDPKKSDNYLVWESKRVVKDGKTVDRSVKTFQQTKGSKRDELYRETYSLLRNRVMSVFVGGMFDPADVSHLIRHRRK